MTPLYGSNCEPQTLVNVKWGTKLCPTPYLCYVLLVEYTFPDAAGQRTAFPLYSIFDMAFLSFSFRVFLFIISIIKK